MIRPVKPNDSGKKEQGKAESQRRNQPQRGTQSSWVSESGKSKEETATKRNPELLGFRCRKVGTCYYTWVHSAQLKAIQTSNNANYHNHNDDHHEHDDKIIIILMIMMMTLLLLLQLLLEKDK